MEFRGKMKELRRLTGRGRNSRGLKRRAWEVRKRWHKTDGDKLWLGRSVREKGVREKNSGVGRSDDVRSSYLWNTRLEKERMKKEKDVKVERRAMCV